MDNADGASGALSDRTSDSDGTADAPADKPGDTPAEIVYPTTEDNYDEVVAQGLAGAASARDVSTTNDTPPVIIYKDFDAWFGEARIEETLQGAPFNLVRDVDYAVLPTSALLSPIPDNVVCAIVTSNSRSLAGTALNVRSPAAQGNLANYLSAGGTLLMHLADNMPANGRFFAPGMSGPRTDDVRSNDLVVAPGDTFFHAGVDLWTDTRDDASTASVAWLNSQFAHHGSLEGVIPSDSKIIMTSGAGKPIYAEYAFGAGRVIVGTLTFEFGNEIAPGIGFGHRDRTLTNHIVLALNPGVAGPPGDDDTDNVRDDVDLCLDTVVPEDAPTVCFLTGRYALLDDTGVFMTAPPEDGVEPQVFTIEDTAGCSCSQIVERLGLGVINIEHGCSVEVLTTWMETAADLLL